MRLHAVKTKVVSIGDDLVKIILASLNEQGLQLEDNDVLAVTSKVVAIAEERLVKLSSVKPSDRAKRIAKKFSLQPELAELILYEAGEIYGGVEKAVLTLKNKVLTANAGIDNKNAPKDYVVLWPGNPKKSAERIREEIRRKTGAKIAVLVVDSGLVPLRKGTVGLALAVAGFKPVKDCRGELDIYGKLLAITQHAIADDLASAAHLLMSEAAEKTPVVLVKDAPVEFDDGAYDSAEMMMPFKECIFTSTFLGDADDSKKAQDLRSSKL
ncbi:coenzyme F420-0:L-glutamate ligase [Candidatus Bathyarchaeota archaeon]|nr:coenzyme F420-0:L-glutamate ligase [Candidatus Bathyarchaeota archaeon]